MKPMLFAVLLLVAGAAGAAPYSCPPPLSPSQVGCTFKSVGGTTTFTANVSAQVVGNRGAGSAVALYMSLDALPCNSNAGEAVFATSTFDAGLTINGTCTFDVPSTKAVELVAVAPYYNATPAYIALAASSIAFTPDFQLAVSTVGGGTVSAADGTIDCGADCAESYSPGKVVTLSANAAAGWTFAGWSGDCTGTGPACTVVMSAARAVTATFTFGTSPPVVEFYNAGSDHYFITADPAEAAMVDGGGAGPGWVRTGSAFNAGGNVPVCRFYGSIAPGPNSHFYTAVADECNFLRQLATTTPSAQPRWNFEGYAFSTTLPAGSTCPIGTVPVFRAYNNGYKLGKESNHRITSNVEAINQVVARGWKFEGVVMCAPQ